MAKNKPYTLQMITGARQSGRTQKLAEAIHEFAYKNPHTSEQPSPIRVITARPFLHLDMLKRLFSIATGFDTKQLYENVSAEQLEIIVQNLFIYNGRLIFELHKHSQEDPLVLTNLVDTSQGAIFIDDVEVDNVRDITSLMDAPSAQIFMVIYDAAKDREQMNSYVETRHPCLT